MIGEVNATCCTQSRTKTSSLVSLIFPRIHVFRSGRQLWGGCLSELVTDVDTYLCHSKLSLPACCSVIGMYLILILPLNMNLLVISTMDASQVRQEE